MNKTFYKILYITFFMAYIAWYALIVTGAAFITDILFKSNEVELECMHLNDTTRLNFAKMTIIMFWLVFVPLMATSIFIIYKNY